VGERLGRLDKKLDDAWDRVNSKHTKGDQTKRSPYKLAKLKKNATNYLSAAVSAKVKANRGISSFSTCRPYPVRSIDLSHGQDHNCC
jgi:hypothetical protein